MGNEAHRQMRAINARDVTGNLGGSAQGFPSLPTRYKSLSPVQDGNPYGCPEDCIDWGAPDNPVPETEPDHTTLFNSRTDLRYELPSTTYVNKWVAQNK